jgi:acyl carrier protein
MTQPWTDETILSGVTDIVRAALRKKAAVIDPGTRLFEDLGAESLDLIDIRFRIEKHFGFKIEQDEIARTVSSSLTPQEIRQHLNIQHLVDFIRNRLAQGSPGP